MPSLLWAQEPLLSIQVEPTEDRWIHFPDGAKLRHGMEISHLLNQYLFESGKFRVQLPRPQGIGLQPPQKSEDLQQELAERLPHAKINYFAAKGQSPAGDDSQAQIIIRPRVHTLLYASGKRSNRVVYGFSPDRLNPYNLGVDGIGKDNDFTAQQFAEVKQCSQLDFFSGQFHTRGWAHRRGNFGADFDEGVSFEILGFGIRFRKKTFAVKLGVEFDVSIPSQGLRQSLQYEFKAEGKDLAIGASYAGLHLGFETQRRKTMRDAIEQSLPKILAEFLQDIPLAPWSIKLEQGWDGQWYIPAGIFDGIVNGQVFEARNGNRYVVTKAMERISQVFFAINNPVLPVHGEELRYVRDPRQSPWAEAIGVGPLAVASGSIRQKLSHTRGPSSQPSLHKKAWSGEIEGFSSPQAVEQTVGHCAESRHSWFEKLVMAVMTFYAHWRYEHIYDQDIPPQPAHRKITGPRVALISTGISPHEKELQGVVDSSGYDFLSWDSRPSDDLGAGTAAAKLLVAETRENFSLIPVKVFGPHGQTHSAAIYGAMQWVAQRQDIELVMIPWAPSITSQAYRDGVQLLIQSGKTVIVPQAARTEASIVAPAGRGVYKTLGLRRAKIRLAPEGVGVVQAAAKWIDQQRKKQ